MLFRMSYNMIGILEFFSYTFSLFSTSTFFGSKFKNLNYRPYIVRGHVDEVWARGDHFNGVTPPPLSLRSYRGCVLNIRFVILWAVSTRINVQIEEIKTKRSSKTYLSHHVKNLFKQPTYGNTTFLIWNIIIAKKKLNKIILKWKHLRNRESSVSEKKSLWPVSKTGFIKIRVLF